MLPRSGRPRGIFRRAWLIIALLGANVAGGIGVALGATLSYEDARAALHTVSDLHESGEAGVSKRNYEARSADSPGLAVLTLNAAEVYGIKTPSRRAPHYTPPPSNSISSSRKFISGSRSQPTSSPPEPSCCNRPTGKWSALL